MKVRCKFLLLYLFFLSLLCKNASAMQINNIGKFGLFYSVTLPFNGSSSMHYSSFPLKVNDRYMWLKAKQPKVPFNFYTLLLIDYKKEGAFKDKIIGMVQNMAETIFSKNGRAVFALKKNCAATLFYLGKSGLQKDMKTYDLAEGKVRKDSLSEVALFSENERYALIKLHGNKGMLTDLHSGSHIEIGLVDHATFSQNNKFLFIYDNKSGSLVDLASCKILLHLHGDSIESVEFSPKGDWLLCKLSDTSTKLIKLKNLSSDNVQVISNDSFSFDQKPKVIVHELGAFNWFDFNPSGKRLLFCGIDREDKVIDLERSDEMLHEQIVADDEHFHIGEGFNSLELKLSPKGRYLSRNVLFGNSVLYDLKNNCSSIFQAEGATFKFSADEKYCACFGRDNAVVLLDLSKEEVAFNLRNVKSVEFCPDNKHVALVFIGDMLRLIDITKEGKLEEKAVLTFQGVGRATFSQDGNYLFLVEGRGSFRAVCLHVSGTLEERTVFYVPAFQRKCHLDLSEQPSILRFSDPKKGIILFKLFCKRVLENVESQKKNLLQLARSNNPRAKKLQDVVIFCEREFEPQRRCLKRKYNERQKPNKRQKLEEFEI